MRRPVPAQRATSLRRRALGQHFLSNLAAARRIVERFDPVEGARVIEIGPGRGVLTALLLEAGAEVIAVEVDPGLADHLRRRFAASSTFTVVEADVLGCDLGRLAGGAPVRVLANLPYSITGEIMLKLFSAAELLTDMTLMLQREVVNRIVAAPGGRVYGSISVLAQYFTDPRAVLELGPGSFSPPPAVSSTVVVMPFRKPRELAAEDEALYPAYVRLLFGHRRRTLLNNLRSATHATPPLRRRLPGLAAPAESLARAGLDPGRRPETLGRAECLALFGSLSVP